jgi:hypothetical protein
MTIFSRGLSAGEIDQTTRIDLGGGISMSVGGPDGGTSAPVEAAVEGAAGGGISQEADSGGAHPIRASPATASGTSAHGDQVGWDEGP